MKIFTIDANIMPIKPIKRNEPQADKSFFVVYPNKLSAPKEPDVMRKTRAMLVPVYAKKMYDRDNPMSPEKIQKDACADVKDIRVIRALR